MATYGTSGWVSGLVASGDGDGDMTLTAGAYYGRSPRYQKLTVSASGATSQVVKIKQLGQTDFISMSSANLTTTTGTGTVAVNATTVKITGYSNCAQLFCSLKAKTGASTYTDASNSVQARLETQGYNTTFNSESTPTVSLPASYKATPDDTSIAAITVNKVAASGSNPEVFYGAITNDPGANGRYKFEITLTTSGKNTVAAAGKVYLYIANAASNPTKTATVTITLTAAGATLTLHAGESDTSTQISTSNDKLVFTAAGGYDSSSTLKNGSTVDGKIHVNSNTSWTAALDALEAGSQW